MIVREAANEDVNTVLEVVRRAFNRGTEAVLVRTLLSDPSAEPRLSLVAIESASGKAVGHALFTAATIEAAERTVPAAILAPLAVVPEAQRKGWGGRLISEGLYRLSRAGVEILFVLGEPKYYARHGFAPAAPWGLEAPFPIPAKHAGAWMAQGLRDNVAGAVTGKVRCAEALNKLEYWKE